MRALKSKNHDFTIDTIFFLNRMVGKINQLNPDEEEKDDFNEDDFDENDFDEGDISPEQNLSRFTVSDKGASTKKEY